MRNNYEVPEAMELSRARNLILGDKSMCPHWADAWLGIGWRTEQNDIDESEK